MNIEDTAIAQKLTLFVNTVIFIYVCLFTYLYSSNHVGLMVKASYIYIVVYLLFYILIKKKLFYAYVISLYAVIVIYMAISTISIGMGAGFFLFGTSLIPIIFYIDYIAQKIKSRRISALVVTGFILAAYVGSTGYTLLNGPIYQISERVLVIIFVINSFSVFTFLISYTRILINMIGDSERKLSEMAHYDALTQIYNRHFMDDFLKEQIAKDNDKQWLAIMDIDFFKKINDTYGHNCGDAVLVEVSTILKEVCKNCTIARWGGEEFVIHSSGETDISILDQLRKKVEANNILFEGNNINCTISVGGTFYHKRYSTELWIQKADENLYTAKNGGRNQVIINN